MSTNSSKTARLHINDWKVFVKLPCLYYHLVIITCNDPQQLWSWKRMMISVVYFGCTVLVNVIITIIGARLASCSAGTSRERWLRQPCYLLRISAINTWQVKKTPVRTASAHYNTESSQHTKVCKRWSALSGVRLHIVHKAFKGKRGLLCLC